jgi:alanine racemase
MGKARCMITVEDARKNLSKEVNEKLSDEDVAAVIADAYTIGILAVEQYLQEKKKNVNKG